jgi:hypothetical protein
MSAPDGVRMIRDCRFRASLISPLASTRNSVTGSASRATTHTGRAGPSPVTARARGGTERDGTPLYERTKAPTLQGGPAGPIQSQSSRLTAPRGAGSRGRSAARSRFRRRRPQADGPPTRVVVAVETHVPRNCAALPTGKRIPNSTQAPGRKASRGPHPSPHGSAQYPPVMVQSGVRFGRVGEEIQHGHRRGHQRQAPTNAPR